MKITVVTLIGAILIGFASLGLIQSNSASANNAGEEAAQAETSTKEQSAPSGMLSEKDLKAQLTGSLAAVFTRDATIVSAKATNIDGIYEVLFNEGSIIYTTLDGEYFFYGSNLGLFQNDDGRVTNLTSKTLALAEKNKAKDRLPILQGIDRNDLVVFSPKGEVKASVIVFTDVDCGYCRKLHAEIDSYLERGIEIKYAAFPRAGVGSDSYKKIVSAWCAPNQQETMTLLKSNRAVEMKNCDNPVASQYQLGRQVGVTGTPSIFTEDGQIIPGYKPADALARDLGI